MHARQVFYLSYAPKPYDFIFQLMRLFLSPLSSWALLHLTMVKLVLHNIKTFFPIAGLEFSGKSGI